eukprot:1159406-Pelagomonas_calceolata.AAC.12
MVPTPTSICSPHSVPHVITRLLPDPHPFLGVCAAHAGHAGSLRAGDHFMAHLGGSGQPKQVGR